MDVWIRKRKKSGGKNKRGDNRWQDNGAINHYATFYCQPTDACHEVLKNFVCQILKSKKQEETQVGSKRLVELFRDWWFCGS